MEFFQPSPLDINLTTTAFNIDSLSLLNREHYWFM